MPREEKDSGGMLFPESRQTAKPAQPEFPSYSGLSHSVTPFRAPCIVVRGSRRRLPPPKFCVILRSTPTFEELQQNLDKKWAMGYYIRVLSPCDQLPSFESLRNSVNKFKSVSLTVAGNPEDWRQLLLTHADDSPIASIERNLVQPGALGEAEIEEFIEEIADCKPQSAVPWLENYLRKVKCV